MLYEFGIYSVIISWILWREATNLSIFGSNHNSNTTSCSGSFDQGSDQVNVKFSVHTGWPNGYCLEKATTCWKARLEQFELKRADFNAENIVIMGKTSKKKLALTIGL